MPPNETYRLCTPVVGVSVQVCVAQAPLVAVTGTCPSERAPVCESACSARVVALCAFTRSATAPTPASLKSTLSKKT